jgi:hypothetical protein
VKVTHLREKDKSVELEDQIINLREQDARKIFCRDGMVYF